MLAAAVECAASYDSATTLGFSHSAFLHLFLLPFVWEFHLDFTCNDHRFTALVISVVGSGGGGGGSVFSTCPLWLMLFSCSRSAQGMTEAVCRTALLRVLTLHA